MVIAILGILAAIAIPRFAGFTKQRADDQYAALVGNSLVVMLAAEDYATTNSTTDAVFAITAADGAVTATSGVSATNAFDPAELVLLVTPKALVYYMGGMTVTVTPDGSHSATGVVAAS